MTLDMRHYKAMLLAVLIIVGAGLQCGRAGVNGFALAQESQDVITAQTGGELQAPGDKAAKRYVVIEVVYQPMVGSKLRIVPGYRWIYEPVPVLFIGTVIKFITGPAGYEPSGRAL